jgi:predicted CXXCH cytochrome family protein
LGSQHARTGTTTGRRTGSALATWVWGLFVTVSMGTAIGLGPVRPTDQPPATPNGFASSMGLHGTGWTDTDCGSCHDIDPVFSHPVGFVPDRPLPENFPLQGGQMTCMTCHDGDDAQTHAMARGNHDPMLRSSLEGRGFCAECHTDGGYSSQNPHATAVSRAHLLWPDDTPDRVIGRAFARLDAESSSCLECHDGMVASGKGSHAPGMRIDDFPSEHPIGVLYRSVRDGKGMNRMVHPHALDKRVRLFDGTVGCGSCHSVYSPLKDGLVMSNQASALCLSCHDG